MKTAAPRPPASATSPASQSRLPLRGWALELARRWNGGTYSLFVLHGNIFDLFPVQDDSSFNYVPLKPFLVRRLFPERACLMFYDISEGLTFGSSQMQKRFFEWLEVYDNVENTNFHQAGPPRDFVRLALDTDHGKDQNHPHVCARCDVPRRAHPATGRKFDDGPHVSSLNCRANKRAPAT